MAISLLRLQYLLPSVVTPLMFRLVMYPSASTFSGIDTRALTKKIREKGTMLGKVRTLDMVIDVWIGCHQCLS